MKNSIPLWVTWLVFAIAFITYGITHLLLLGVLADILLLVAIVESVRKFISSRKAKRQV
jgi:hypothetical protein